jgi:ribosomal protein RSM22 (predicted rRNA methylase)
LSKVDDTLAPQLKKGKIMEESIKLMEIVSDLTVATIQDKEWTSKSRVGLEEDIMEIYKKYLDKLAIIHDSF